jgi:hypothetical protein
VKGFEDWGEQKWNKNEKVNGSKLYKKKQPDM